VASCDPSFSNPGSNPGNQLLSKIAAQWRGKFSKATSQMKRLVVTLLFGLIALPGAARAEDPVGCALTSAPLMAQPDGSILIGCAGGLTDPFGEQLVNVLNKMLQSRLDPQAVLGKLEEVEAVPEQGVARTVSDNQRHAIMQALSGKQAEQIAVVAHPLAEDSAEFGKGIAAPLIMLGWQIEGNQIRRAAPRVLDPVAGVAIVVRSRDAIPPKAQQLKAALTAAHIGVQLIADPGMAADGALLWIGRRPVFMQADAKR
jgi:hypothetical protein